MLTEADVERVAERLVAVLPRAIVEIPESPTSIREILAPLGDTQTERVSRAAVALAGTSDKRTRAYKSARRRIERYVTQGRERRGVVRPRLEQIARQVRRPHLPVDRGVSVELGADVLYVGQHKPQMPASGEGQEISASELSTVRRHLRDGDELAAARALLDEWVYQYRLATDRDADGVIGNIDRVRIELL